MALGYEVGAIMKRRSRQWSDELLTIKIDWIEGLDKSYTQIQAGPHSSPPPFSST